jgi:hypothetical protein
VKPHRPDRDAAAGDLSEHLLQARAVSLRVEHPRQDHGGRDDEDRRCSGRDEGSALHYRPSSSRSCLASSTSLATQST